MGRYRCTAFSCQCQWVHTSPYNFVCVCVCLVAAVVVQWCLGVPVCVEHGAVCRSCEKVSRYLLFGSYTITHTGAAHCGSACQAGVRPHGCVAIHFIHQH